MTPELQPMKRSCPSINELPATHGADNPLAAAMRAAEAGLSVVPPREDGTKAAKGYWTEFQSRRASTDEIEAWYATGRDGVGVVTGAISGNLELFEFEGRAVEAGIWEAFQDAAAALGLGDALDRVCNGYREDTPSGGVHLLWRCDEIEGSKTLARCPGEDGKAKVLIETKGEAGYAVVAPSGGHVHETGGQYQLRCGGFETIARVTPDERAGLLDLARSFDQLEHTKAFTTPRSEGRRGGRAGDDYNASAIWTEILEPHDWAYVYTSSDGNAHWRRPGKRVGTSATVSPDGEYLYVFSTSTNFDAGRAYNKFGAYTILNHDGDFRAAADALRKQGYGHGHELAPEVNGKPSQSKLLIDLAEVGYRFATSTDGRPFAIAKHGPRIARPLRGGKRSFRGELSCLFREKYERVASSSALADALTTLEGIADRSSETMHLRVGATSDGIVLDLGDETGRAVVVNANGWEVIDESPSLFERSELTGPLPIPIKGGHLDELRQLVNVDDASWPLLIGWLIAALFPDIPHPIMTLLGEQGTAKTTTAARCASLIDPSPVQVRTAPRDMQDWAVAAHGSWIVALDNLSRISEALSDALCRAVTGDGIVRRALYTNSDLSVLAFRRAIIITSIETEKLRGDLADRLVVIDLQRIDPSARRTDKELNNKWAECRPRVLGALLDLTCAVLNELPRVDLPVLPRMADFARILAAVDRVHDLGALDAYLGLADRLADDVIEGDPVAQAVVQFMTDKPTWTGSPAELHAIVTPSDRIPKDWPTNPTAFSASLTRSAPALRQRGIDVARSRTSTKRLITLTNDHAVSRTGPTLDWHKPSKRSESNDDPMTGMTDPPATVTETVIPSRRSDQGERPDRDGNDANDGLHRPLSMKGEERGGDIDKLIADFENEFDAVVVSERSRHHLADSATPSVPIQR